MPKVPAELIDVLMDNTIVRTALHNEAHEIQQIAVTSGLGVVLFITAAIMNFGFKMNLDDLPFLMVMSLLAMDFALMVGLYPMFNWKTSAWHKNFRIYGVGGFVGNLIAFPINLYFIERIQIPIMIFAAFLVVVALWVLNVSYRRWVILRGLEILKPHLSEADLVALGLMDD